MAAHAAPKSNAPWFAIGGPLFNLAMIALLMGISTFVVMSPAEGTRPDDDQLATGPGNSGGYPSSWPAEVSFVDVESGAPVVSPTPSGGNGSAADGTGGGDDGGGGGGTTAPSDGAEPTPPASGAATGRYERQPFPTPIPTATPQPTATPIPTATPYPTATPKPTRRPKPTATPVPKPTSIPLPRCADFADRQAAQDVFDTDPVGLAHMDGDGDGLACEQLPPPPGPPVPSYGEVLASTGIYGVHTREAPWWMGEVDYFSRLTGRTPGTLLFFSNFGQAFPAEEVESSWARGMLPVVAWEPIIPGAVRQPQLAQIIDGSFDGYIDAWAAAARDAGTPIVLRLAAEMNGHWYPWSEGTNGNVEGEFVQAWQRVHDRFEAAGATNVVWLWSVNRSNNIKTDIADFYPGDDYVDWVGLSGYLRKLETGIDPTFTNTFGKTLGELRALTSKPILLSEVGAGTDEINKTAWTRSLFAGLASSPDVIGFIWFNDAKTGGDWRIQTSQAVVDAFADGVASTRWRTGVDPIGMRTGQRITIPAAGES